MPDQNLTPPPRGRRLIAFVFLGATAVGGLLSLVGFFSTVLLVVVSRSSRRDWMTWVAMALFLLFQITLQTLAGHRPE